MPEPLKVLLVAPFDGARWTSISAYASALAACKDDDIQFETAYAPWWNPLSLVESGRRRWWRQPEIRRAIKGEYDVVHLTDQALGHHVWRFRRQPVVVTCHDLMPFNVPGYYRGRLESLVKRRFLRHSIRGMLTADQIIAVSQYTASAVEDLQAGVSTRVSVVPNMVRPVLRPVEGAECLLVAAGVHLPTAPRVLSVGHAGPYKGLEGLLQAFAARPELATAALIRVGSRLSPKQRRLADALGLEGRIVELGRIDDGMLAAVYSVCDVLAQPSVAEGFGVPVIEAMACGLPVVVSDGGALAGVVGDAGVVVPRGLDAAGFALRFGGALAAVLEDGSALRARGLARAACFAPETVMPHVAQAYRAASAARVSREGGRVRGSR